MKVNQKNNDAGDVNNTRVPCSQCGRDYGHACVAIDGKDTCVSCGKKVSPPAPAVSTETGRAYRPRKGFVICRCVQAASAGGVALPDRAVDSKVNYVVAVGPDITDIKVGDRVMVASGGGGAYAKLMDEKELYITPQENVLLVWEEAAP